MNIEAIVFYLFAAILLIAIVPLRAQIVARYEADLAAGVTAS